MHARKHALLPMLAIAVGMSCALFAHAAFATLTLAEAERLALAKDPMAAKWMAESRALATLAVADGALRDPRLTLGMTAIPLDSLDMEQEGMTQRKVGIQQGFPRGDTLRLKKEQTQAMSRKMRLKVALEHREIIRGVRLSYQDVIYRQRAYQTVTESRAFFQQLVEIVEFRYTSGKAKRQNLLEASLALSRMTDRLLKIQNMADMARARLSQWIPREAAFGVFPMAFPTLPPVPDRSKRVDLLGQHPSVLVAEVAIEVQGLELLRAQEHYKPGWMMDANYGYRAGNNPDKSARSDFLSVMVSLDLPLFTENRQDRVQEARRLQVQAAEWDRDDRLRNLATALETHQATHARLAERLQVFADRLLPEAQQYTETTMASYQSRVADLTDVVRARLAELNVRLDLLEVRFKQQETHANLLFLTGDGS